MSADAGKDDQVIQHDAGPAGVVPEPGDSLEPMPPADASATSDSPERRELSFRTSGLSIQLEISGTADSRRLTGQLIPRQSAVVDIRHRAGVITVEADALGRFSAESIPSGAVSMRFRLGPPISTGWIALLIQPYPPADQPRAKDHQAPDASARWDSRRTGRRHPGCARRDHGNSAVTSSPCRLVIEARSASDRPCPGQAGQAARCGWGGRPGRDENRTKFLKDHGR